MEVMEISENDRLENRMKPVFSCPGDKILLTKQAVCFKINLEKWEVFFQSGKSKKEFYAGRPRKK